MELNKSLIKKLILPMVDSPTPTVGISGDSTKVIFRSGNCFIKAEADIHPAEPPPTIQTELIFI